jgi:protein-S-isoprenylcysteine O-methyltransferase Ste14
MTETKKMSKTKTTIRAILTALLFLALLFIPAGTLNWPEAWIFVLFYFSIVSGVLLWLKKKSPGLLRERIDQRKDSKSWDKVIITAYTLLIVGLLVVTGLDAKRFGWSDIPLLVKVLGFLGYFPALGFAFWAMLENAYASNVVRIQEDRGHEVCTTGPYRFIRHPMYVGVIFALISIPLSLGSYYALILSASAIILFIIRTALEDKTLRAELPGYKDYAQKVRYRLFPGIW